ncbi:NAD(P)/FAD-dependent oxidoreductase [Nitritalea halalkaliphila]|uniref:NAD(P)/FAD-dependent oxidoreductase n=1 Tax=Nitritalea halalkaliphila TaxID=590849 RepID=UPI000300BC34|nr:NAD(P)/FAD-dependent oxidoreductase [Nitritalea halalkaliphila]
METKKYVQGIPKPSYQRVLIVGGGFAGLKVARELKGSAYQVVMIDKNNYHQFQPLYYQVATSGLEPSAIAFPFRKVFKRDDKMLFRMLEFKQVDVEAREIETDAGWLAYDYLVLAIGADTHFFGMENIRKHATPMKTISEALFLRNKLISNFEAAYNTDDLQKRESLLNVVVVGGGPTGVELAGAIAEMRRDALPLDYPTMDWKRMRVCLLEASPRLLNGMSEASGQKSLAFLEKLGVDVTLNAAVKDFDGEHVLVADGQKIAAKTLIWAAGVRANPVPGLPEEAFLPNGRVRVNRFNQVEAAPGVYAIGDLAYMETPKFSKGHPQVAQVAIQQAKNLSYNFRSLLKERRWEEFEYKDLGSMATVGQKLAVVDLPYLSFQALSPGWCGFLCI